VFLVAVVAVALVASLAIFVPRLGWERSDLGYDIVERTTVAPDQPFTLPLPITASSYGPVQGNRFSGVLDVYTDEALTRPYPFVSTSSKLTFTGMKGLFTSSRAAITTSRVLPTSVGEPTLGNADSWPAGTYYVAERENIVGLTLARARVHVFTVASDTGSLASPDFTLAVTDQGIPRVTWTSVDQASAYYILTATPTDLSTGVAALDWTLVGTADADATSWLASSQDMAYQNSRQLDQDISTYNTGFQAISATGDACTPQDQTYQGATPPAWDDSALLFPSYAVVAVDAQGNTSLPMERSGRDLIAATPVATAEKTWEQMTTDAASPLFIPDEYPVTMGDCRTVFFPVAGQSWIASSDASSVTVTYSITGTLLTQSITGTTSQEQDTVRTLGAQLGLRHLVQLGPMEDLDVMSTREVDQYGQATVPSTQAPESPYTWNGTSPMVTYIAANMFAGNTAVDLCPFTADPSSPLIYDAANEAFLQNPYITDMAPVIGIRGCTLYVDYEMSADDRASAAARIHDKVVQVVSSIITPDMDDRAKALAINRYVATTATYDTAAADFSLAGSHTVQEYLDRFPHSWDAEGVLIDGTGVCSSYAAAFKLLADAAGLASVTVTGTVDAVAGGHEWVKARIDGQWWVIDPTWNSNIWEHVRGNVQTYFGLSDAAAARTPFDSFVVNSHIGDYDTP